jgi:hypothetical protein
MLSQDVLRAKAHIWIWRRADAPTDASPPRQIGLARWCQRSRTSACGTRPAGGPFDGHIHGGGRTRARPRHRFNAAPAKHGSLPVPLLHRISSARMNRAFTRLRRTRSWMSSTKRLLMLQHSCLSDIIRGCRFLRSASLTREASPTCRDFIEISDSGPCCDRF